MTLSSRPWEIEANSNFMSNTNTRLYDFARLVFRRWDKNKKRSALMMREFLMQYWPIVLFALAANLFAALFESSTMGILTISLEVLAGEVGTDLESSLGAVGVFAGSLQDQLGRDGLFLVLIGLAVLTQLLRSGLIFGSKAAAAHLTAHVSADGRARIFRQFMNMSYAQVSRYKTGDLTSYADQAIGAGNLIFLSNLFLSEVLIVVSYAAVLFWLSWSTTLGALVALLLLSSFLGNIIRRVREMAQEFIHKSVELNELTVEFLQGMRLVRVFSREDYAIDKVDSALYSSAQAKRKGMIWEETIKPLVESMTVLGLAIFLVGGFLLLSDQGLSVLPRMTTFLFVIYRLMPRIGTINKTIAKIIGLSPTIDRITEILRTDNKEYTVDGDVTYPGLGKVIKFNEVSLRYIEGEQRAVKDLSITIAKGDMIALVGESGAGKSTVIDLLLRLYDPTAGQILIDGVDLRQLNLNSWREYIGVVSQDTIILHASIRDNIAFGRLEASTEQIVAAAQAANAHEFILDMANGYDTVVGDRGYRLSGGQRQRLAIARAILRNPEILVLDEATSDLDSRSEQLIQTAIDELRSERTVFAIAHRLSTITAADQILVLEKGELMEHGTHKELLAQNGRYAYFWQIQSGSGSSVEKVAIPS